MALNKTFLQHAAENAIGAAAAGALSALAVTGENGGAHALADIPWSALATGLIVGGLVSLLKSAASLKVDNGTASVLPQVVAAPQADPGKTA